MTRRRVYIQKDSRDPIFDLWIELENCTESEPYINLCCNGEEGKAVIVSLTPATASRMINGMDEFLKKCYEPIEDYVVEKDDQVGNH